MNSARLQLCREGFLVDKGVDYRLVSTVYNLCYWIKGNKAYVFLPGDVVNLAIIDYSGEYKVYSENCGDTQDLTLKLRFALGLGEDLTSFYDLARRDPLLGDFAEFYSNWRLRSTSLWWALVIGICQQNASFKQGWRILHNIVKAYGKRIFVESEEVLRPPTPREVLEDPEKLLASGTGFRARAIINAAKAITSSSLDPEHVASVHVTEAERELKKIKGIGSYTARLTLALSMRKYELPPIDRWLKKVASVVYGVDEHFVEEYWVEKWGKWSGLAAIAVTIALDAEPLTRALERVRERELTPKPSVKPSPMNMAAFCEAT